jgi:hypothetical protein
MWEELYENTKKFLIAPVSRMVQKGWLSLDITSYNLVASFDKFLKNFIRIGADLSASNTPTINIRIIEGFLRNYLKIVFVKEYREILEEAISEFVLTDKRFKSNYKQVRRLVKEFIDVESRSLCFFNIINAVYIIHYNRFIKLPELCKYYGVEDINHKKYNFSPKIESDVKDYIKKIEHKYNLAESELFFLKYIEEIDFNSKPDNPVVDAFNNVFLYEYIKSDRDLDDLKELLEKEEADERLKNTNLNPFAYLKLDIPRYILKFITGYRIIYRNILTEPIPIEITDDDDNTKEEKVTIFQNEPFTDNFNKIAEATRELSILTQNEKLTVTSKSYLHYIERRLLESKDAEMACKHIESIISNLYFVSSKLSNALYRNYKASTLQANDLLQAYKNQHEPVNVKSEEYNLIPYSFNIITNNRYHENKKIIDVLNEIMYVTVNIAYLFRYENLMDRLIKKPELINDSEYYVKIKSKIFN